MSDNNSTNPFKGLQSYGPGDSSKLFGRERDLILMKDRIFSARTTLLFAGSGVGKTSFLNAKVIPELQGQYSTFYHSRWAGPSKPLEAVKTTLAERIENADKRDRLIDCFEEFVYKPAPDEVIGADDGDGNTAHKQCLLIFDQFEEIFQYHAYEDYFKRFLTEVCEVVRRDDYRVHLVISMREEYLGELSVFDNLIPDLFNNYYRLRYPNKRDAAQIIEGTCRTVGTTVHRQNLDELISDLSKIEKGVASAAERSTQGDKAVGHVVERNFIIPPYLQIVCHRKWDEQAKDATNNGNDSIVFLESYKPNQAQAMLRDYCEEKLSALSFMEQNVAERSFDFLVTKQGAKMAYEFTSLVEHMRLRFFKARLKGALNKLSVPETRILRKSHGPDGSVWFELYHDIYGKILDTWRASFRARKHKLTVLFGLVALVLLLILIPITWHWGYKPYQSRKTLVTSHLEKPEEYRRAVEAYDGLAGTWGYGNMANSLLADAWERRAQYAESHNERDEAIMSWLKALSLKPDAPHADFWRLKAGNLTGGDYQRLNHRLYHDNLVLSAIFSDDGQLVITKTDDGRIWLWNAKSGALIGKHDDPQSSARRGPSQFSATSSAATPSSLPTPDTTISRGKPKYNMVHAAGLNPELGWIVAVTFNTDQEEQARYKRYHEQFIPRPVLVLSNGDELIDSPIQTEAQWLGTGYGNSDVAISGDGKLIATTGRGQTTRVWKIGAGEATPADGFNIDGFIQGVAFSPDGKSLITVMDNQRMAMWDVATGQLRYAPLSHPGGYAFYKFNNRGDSFVVVYGDGEQTLAVVRNTTTGEPLRKPINSAQVSPQFDTVSLTADNTIQSFTSSGSAWIADLASNEFRKMARLDATENPVSKLAPGGQVALSFQENVVWLHRPDWQAKNDSILNAGEIVETSVLTEDGTRIVTLIRKPDPNKEPLSSWYEPETEEAFRVQAWDANTLAPIGDTIDNVILLSDDGEYVATTEPKKKSRKTQKAADAGKGPEVRILNVRTGSEVMKFQYPNEASLTRLISSAGGKFFAILSARKDYDYWYPSYEAEGLPRREAVDVYVWDRDDASRPVASISIPTSSQYTCAFSQDEMFFAASGSSGTGIELWDLAAKQQVQLTKNLGNASTLAFNKHGHLVAGASKTLRIWDLTTRQPIGDLDAFARINTVALTADGRTILMGDVNGSVSSWKFPVNAAATPIGEVRHRDTPNSVTFSVNENAGIISAGNWLHTTNVNDHRYVTSYFLGSKWLKQCRSMNDSGSQFRCLFQLPDGTPNVKDIKAGEIPDNMRVEGDATSVFETWSSRLGLTINNLGKIVPKQSSAAPAATETQKQ